MQKHVTWILDLLVNDGQEETFRTFMEDMVASTRGEHATLCYQWFMTPDGKRAQTYERFADSSAAMTHLSTFREKYFERFFKVITPERCTIYGAPSDEVREFMAPLNPEYFVLTTGFLRPEVSA